MSAAEDQRRYDRHAWIICAGVLATYLAMTVLRRVFVLPEALAPIWPATAILAAGLLLLDGARRMLLLACGAAVLAVLIGVVNNGGSVRSLIGVPESLLLAYLTHKCLGRSPDFCDGRKIALYVAGAALPSSLIACIALFVISQFVGKPASVLNAFQWGSAHFLGAALTLPSVVILVKARKYRPYGASILGAVASCLALMAYAAGFLWGGLHTTMLLAFPVALWIAVRYGPIGAAILAISLIGLSIAHAYLTLAGLIHPTYSSPWVAQFATLLFLTTLPTAGMVATLRRTRNVLKRQTETAREARHRADQAAQAKAQFLANMSHEIRTPLNGVLGLADAVSRTPLADDQRKMIEMICISGQTLNRLLSDSLDLARADSGVLRLEEQPFDLADAVGAATLVFETLARDKAVEFSVRLDNHCGHAPVGDALRIRQIVANLTGNAVKFTQAGHVHVTAALAPAGNCRGRLTVEVEDTGPGFDEAAKARMFTRFEQADETIARSHGGAGLGLAISQTLAAMMGGVIECRSSPGRGSTFSFSVELPLSEAAAHPSPEQGEAQPHAASRPIKVLLAEDHPVNQQVVQILLGDHADLTIVENGQEALDALARESFDVVLMDTQMPVLDGVAAIRELRARERGQARRTPVISLTASAMPQQVMAVLEAGADLHLAKPITMASLFGAISQVIEPETLTENRSGAAA